MGQPVEGEPGQGIGEELLGLAERPAAKAEGLPLDQDTLVVANVGQNEAHPCDEGELRVEHAILIPEAHPPEELSHRQELHAVKDLSLVVDTLIAWLLGPKLRVFDFDEDKVTTTRRQRRVDEAWLVARRVVGLHYEAPRNSEFFVHLSDGGLDDGLTFVVKQTGGTDVAEDRWFVLVVRVANTGTLFVADAKAQLSRIGVEGVHGREHEPLELERGAIVQGDAVVVGDEHALHVSPLTRGAPVEAGERFAGAIGHDHPGHPAEVVLKDFPLHALPQFGAPGEGFTDGEGSSTHLSDSKYLIVRIKSA